MWSTSVWHRSPHQAFARASTAAIRVFILASFASMIGFVYNESIPALEFLPTFYTSHRRNNCAKPSDATMSFACYGGSMSSGNICHHRTRSSVGVGVPVWNAGDLGSIPGPGMLYFWYNNLALLLSTLDIVYLCVFLMIH